MNQQSLANALKDHELRELLTKVELTDLRNVLATLAKNAEIPHIKGGVTKLVARAAFVMAINHWPLVKPYLERLVAGITPSHSGCGCGNINTCISWLKGNLRSMWKTLEHGASGGELCCTKGSNIVRGASSYREVVATGSVRVVSIEAGPTLVCTDGHKYIWEDSFSPAFFEPTNEWHSWEIKSFPLNEKTPSALKANNRVDTLQDLCIYSLCSYADQINMDQFKSHLVGHENLLGDLGTRAFLYSMEFMAKKIKENDAEQRRQSLNAQANQNMRKRKLNEVISSN